MSVKIRLTRRGRKKLALYDVIVADSRSPRDGRFIEKIGTYNPNTNPATINLESDRAVYWLMVGAQPSDTVRAMLSYRGIMYRKHLQVGVNKGAFTQEVAEERYQEWLTAKESKVGQKVTGLADTKEKQKADRLEAESKVRQARQDVLDQRTAAARAEEDARQRQADEAAAASAAAIQAQNATETAVEEAHAVEAEAPEAVAEEATAPEATVEATTATEESTPDAEEEAPATVAAEEEAPAEEVVAPEAAAEEAPKAE